MERNGLCWKNSMERSGLCWDHCMERNGVVLLGEAGEESRGVHVGMGALACLCVCRMRWGGEALLKRQRQSRGGCWGGGFAPGHVCVGGCQVELGFQTPPLALFLSGCCSCMLSTAAINSNSSSLLSRFAGDPGREEGGEKELGAHVVQASPPGWREESFLQSSSPGKAAAGQAGEDRWVGGLRKGPGRNLPGYALSHWSFALLCFASACYCCALHLHPLLLPALSCVVCKEVSIPSSPSPSLGSVPVCSSSPPPGMCAVLCSVQRCRGVFPGSSLFIHSCFFPLCNRTVHKGCPSSLRLCLCYVVSQISLFSPLSLAPTYKIRKTDL